MDRVTWSMYHIHDGMSTASALLAGGKILNVTVHNLRAVLLSEAAVTFLPAITESLQGITLFMVTPTATWGLPAVCTGAGLRIYQCLPGQLLSIACTQHEVYCDMPQMDAYEVLRCTRCLGG